MPKNFAAFRPVIIKCDEEDSLRMLVLQLDSSLELFYLHNTSMSNSGKT